MPDRRRSRQQPRASLPCSSRARCGSARRHASASASASCVRDRRPASGSSPRCASRFRILGDYHRPRDVAAAVLGPTLQDGKIEQRKPLRADHILALPVTHRLGKNDQARRVSEAFSPCPECPAATACPESTKCDRDLVQKIHLERQIHAPLGTNHVRHRGKPRAFCALEQQRRAALLDRAVRNLGDFQHRIDLGRHALELAFLFQFAQKISQIAIRHFPSLEIQSATIPRLVFGGFRRQSRLHSRGGVEKPVGWAMRLYC